MTITPSELDAMQEAEQLLDTVCHAAGVYLTATQRARALATLEVELDQLRRRWAQRIADYLRTLEPSRSARGDR